MPSPAPVPLLPAPRLKAALFDIGGVCVVSPFLGIQAFERRHNLPHNWINYAISRSGVAGAWQRLERGEIGLEHAADAQDGQDSEDSFFAAFRRDLHDQTVWEEYWTVFLKRRKAHESVKRTTQQPPEMDTTALFWEMMSVARTPDPLMAPTLRYLRAASPALLLAALSNTVRFPPEHPFAHPAEHGAVDPRAWFDVFVSSSEVGMRKPAREIYEFALEQMRAWAEAKGKGKGEGKGKGKEEDLRPQDVVFLDDIGENCKMGKLVGMHVIKVELGRTAQAVTELGRRLFGIEDLVGRVQEWEKKNNNGAAAEQAAKSRL